MWVDGVELDVKQHRIYLIKHYGLEEKAQTILWTAPNLMTTAVTSPVASK
jgi:hypothetical protein